MKNKFAYISSFLKSKNRRITSHLDSNDQLVYSDGEIAQLLGNKFSSVFNKDFFPNLDLSSKVTDFLCKPVIVTEYQIFNIISKLPEKNNSSIDSMPCIFLKIVLSLYYPLLYLFLFNHDFNNS